MADDTKKPGGTEGKVLWSPERLEAAIRERVRETIETVLEAELDAAVGAGLSARVADQRRGYRHGHRTRVLTTSVGPTAVAVPRARLRTEGGSTEWRSEMLPRCQRRTAWVDQAIVGVYLAGGDSRRIRGALAPLLRGGRCGRRTRSSAPTTSSAGARTRRRACRVRTRSCCCSSSCCGPVTSGSGRSTGGRRGAGVRRHGGGPTRIIHERPLTHGDRGRQTAPAT
jgi:hypothetical protein